MKRIFPWLLDLLFPDDCPVCGSPAGPIPHAPFCAGCWGTIKPFTGPACSRCGIPLVSEAGRVCGECLTDPPAFDRLVCFGLYDGVLREALRHLKFRGRRGLARPLAGFFHDPFLGLFDDLSGKLDRVVPVPLHPKRLKDREFNQAALLSRFFSRTADVPLDLHGLVKVKNTPPQVGLSRTDRLKNEGAAFAIAPDHDLRGRSVLLMDDVCTTGATLRACAKVLRKAGAGPITAVALARSAPDFSIIPGQSMPGGRSGS